MKKCCEELRGERLVAFSTSLRGPARVYLDEASFVILQMFFTLQMTAVIFLNSWQGGIV